MTIIFGEFINDFTGFGTGATSPEEFRDAIAKNA